MKIINPRLSREWLFSRCSGAGVEVAVIDSGVNAAHPDLRNRISRAFTAVNKENGDVAILEVPVEEAKDDSGHGSAAAGLILRIAPGARIISIKVCDGDRTCSRRTLGAALAWVLENGIRLVYMSMSTRSEAKASEIRSLCELAYRRNCIVVAPLENSGCLSFPAAFPTVVGVACGTFESVSEVRYQRGEMVEYVAHGMRVAAPSVTGDHVNVSGTSFASANVAGVIALLLEAFPEMSVFEAKAILKSFSENADSKNGTNGTERGK